VVAQGPREGTLLGAYLRGLERKGSQLEQGAFWEDSAWFALTVGVIFIGIGLSEDAPAVPIMLSGLVIALITLPLLAWTKQASWKRNRELLYAHMRGRVFGAGMLRDYIARIHEAATGRARFYGMQTDSSRLRPEEAMTREQAPPWEPGMNEAMIDSFIEFFLGSSTADQSRSYRHEGGTVYNGKLIRATLYRMLATELQQGIEVFEESAPE
jgi:hypothetical protein